MKLSMILRDAGTGVQYGGTATPALWKGGNGDTGALTQQYHKYFHYLSKSTWNKFIAAIRAHIKFRMVFHDFCYLFWG